MSKERFDVAIGILDHTENEIERIKNQHKFEKDLSEFLNTNAYSKDKYWVAGMLNQVSEYCKDKIDALIEKDLRIAELEEQLKNAIVVPKELQVGNKVYFIDIEEKYIHKGKIYSITKELNYEENGFITWIYCRYNDGLTFTHPIRDYGVELFATKEEAQAKLEEVRGE